MYTYIGRFINTHMQIHIKTGGYIDIDINIHIYIYIYIYIYPRL